MKLPDKIIQLRKSNGWSQEDLAEKLNISRQAISRWESATAQPDAANILHLSRLFGVTTDYLLNDEYESDNDLPKVKEVKSDGFHQIMIFMITLEVMILIIQFIAIIILQNIFFGVLSFILFVAIIILQNIFFGVLSFILFVAIIGGFEYSYQKRKSEANENAQAFRKKFYKISVWVGICFPIRFIVRTLSNFYPRPYSTIALEGVILVIYLMTATLICLQIDKNSKKNCSQQGQRNTGIS